MEVPFTQDARKPSLAVCMGDPDGRASNCASRAGVAAKWKLDYIIHCCIIALHQVWAKRYS